MYNRMQSSDNFNFNLAINDRGETPLMSYFWCKKKFSSKKWIKPLTDDELYYLIENSDLNKEDNYGTNVLSYALESEVEISPRCWELMIKNTDFSKFADNNLFVYFRAKHVSENKTFGDHLNKGLTEDLKKELEIKIVYEKYQISNDLIEKQEKKKLKI